MIKYIAYCRRSIEQEEKQALSIEAQIAELKEFALKEKLDVVEFLTESKTAKIPGREVFGQLIRKIQQGEVQGILAWHPFMSIPHFFSIRLVSLPVFLRT